MDAMTGLRDVDGYLARVGLRGQPGWAVVHRAHATSIPFENLDPATGNAVSLDPDHLEDKLVARRRGGYCFEHNLLFQAALESLGVGPITPMLARVRQGGAVGVRPRSHLLLRVIAHDGTAWHADVGFGGDTLLDPIPFGPGPPVEQSGWRYRVVEDGAELVLQIWRDGEWLDLYGFVPEPVPMIDIEVANWYTSTNPRSPFVSGIHVGTQIPGVRRTLMAAKEARLTERTPEAVTEHSISFADVPHILATQFGLAGVPIPRWLH
jgi:N-hydroxyarylamine O-acetyltransferase